MAIALFVQGFFLSSRTILMSLLDTIFGSASGRVIKAMKPIVDQINSFDEAMRAESDEGLKNKTAIFKERLNPPDGGGETLDDILPEAFAVVREAARRTLGQRHYDVQLMGGIALHRGSIAEMMTGEGKTLVATLPVYLNALEGKGVHVVTVNDYLSRRDGVWMGKIYAFLGLSVGVINNNASYLYDPAHRELDPERDAVGGFHVIHEFLRPVDRPAAYRADFT